MSKEQNHTPGPWVHKDNTAERTEGRYEGLSYDVWAANNGHYYLVCTTTDGGKEAEANARLIAAAPELLDLADSINESWHILHDEMKKGMDRDSVEYSVMFDILCRLQDQARAALRKATES